jgi:hypothetical protein
MSPTQETELRDLLTTYVVAVHEHAGYAALAAVAAGQAPAADSAAVAAERHRIAERAGVAVGDFITNLTQASVLKAVPRTMPVDRRNIAQVLRISDQSVLVVFTSCHAASVFEKDLKS